jgi:uncharacterized FAD-dependent dehydrogenase
MCCGPQELADLNATVNAGEWLTSAPEDTVALTDIEKSQPRRSVYSFCMCPGGQIVPTVTSEGELCVNGMSFSKHDSKWANSAIVVNIGPEDWAPYQVHCCHPLGPRFLHFVGPECRCT